MERKREIHMKRIICLLLSLVMVLGALSGCGSADNAVEAEAPIPTAEEAPEIIKARELGLIPDEWNGDLAAEADFTGFEQLITSFIKICDESALAVWNENVDENAFPQRTMRRDDALILLLLRAEALGYNYYNAREYAFCTEYIVDYDRMFSQLSIDYPYCAVSRRPPIYFDAGGGDADSCGPIPWAAVYWMQRRMDINQRVHFLDCDRDLDFHLDQPLTREDAVAAVVRLYNSEMLGYDPLTIEMREQTEEDKAILAAAETMKKRILDNADELPCEGTVYYVSGRGDDANDGKSPETAWASL